MHKCRVCRRDVWLTSHDMLAHVNAVEHGKLQLLCGLVAAVQGSITHATLSVTQSPVWTSSSWPFPATEVCSRQEPTHDTCQLQGVLIARNAQL